MYELGHLPESDTSSRFLAHNAGMVCRPRRVQTTAEAEGGRTGKVKRAANVRLARSSSLAEGRRSDWLTLSDSPMAHSSSAWSRSACARFLSGACLQGEGDGGKDGGDRSVWGGLALSELREHGHDPPDEHVHQRRQRTRVRRRLSIRPARRARMRLRVGRLAVETQGQLSSDEPGGWGRRPTCAGASWRWTWAYPEVLRQTIPTESMRAGRHDHRLHESQSARA